MVEQGINSPLTSSLGRLFDGVPVNDRGGNLSAETTTALAPVIAVVFGQAGLLAGASVEGTKYTRIIP